MHIQISNYHNISSLGYDIETNKVNFLYGVSGSGKSSIIRGIKRSIDPEVDTMVGCGSGEEAEVIVNGKAGPLESTVTFDRESQRVLFSPNPERSLYDIFIGSEDNLEALRKQYQEAVSCLRAKTGDLLRLKSEIEALKKTLGRTTRGSFSRASKMGKAIRAYDEASPNMRGYIEERGITASSWVKDGFSIDDSFDKDVCPFCGQNLEQSPRRDVLAELRDLSVKDLKPLFDSPEQLAALRQDPIDLSSDEGRHRAEKLVDALPTVCDEVDRIIGYCNAGIDYEDVMGMAVGLPNPNPAIYAFMPELREVVDEINAKATEVEALLSKMKTAFNTLVRNGCGDLNGKLVKFGIPYRFELSTANRNEKTASYRLVHVNAGNSVDMRNSLSFGELNLITLILFLQDEESEVMLIDDPASSYDDYRRTQIFKAIMEVQGKTLLVVSHDQAFVRRAVWSREHWKDRIGRVDMLCNRSGKASVVEITKDSFGYFDDKILSRIQSASTYYQRMLNSRLFCEIHNAATSDKNLWGYVSAILHKKSRDEVMLLLDKTGESETDVLARLKERVGKDAAPLIEPMPKVIDFSTESFTEFEKLIALREEIDSGEEGFELPSGLSKKLTVDLLNDLVHMNDAMMDCIDPYRYPVWSPALFQLLG